MGILTGKHLPRRTFLRGLGASFISRSKLSTEFMMRARPSSSSSGGSSGGDGKTPGFVIENLYLRGGQVNVLATQFPEAHVWASRREKDPLRDL